MSFITNAEEAIEALKLKLPDYLISKGILKPGAKTFKCFMHDESTPSMSMFPKPNCTRVHCFGCGWGGDIFDVAAQLEQLPVHGVDFFQETLPRLASSLNIELKTGAVTPEEQERHKLLKLLSDIDQIMIDHGNSHQYAVERGWVGTYMPPCSISKESMIEALMKKGWDYEYIAMSKLIFDKENTFFGEEKVTFTVKDWKGKPVGFICRNIKSEPKYLNSHESLVYKKSEILMGLDIALANGAKKQGVIVVEGVGDLKRLHSQEIYNAVALCGTAMTPRHLVVLKSLDISKIILWLDWDKAGTNATSRLLTEVLSMTSGLEVKIAPPPDSSFWGMDPDVFLQSNSIRLVKPISAFEWQLSQIDENEPPEAICQKMIPSIASEPSAVIREGLIKIIEARTGISRSAINSDVNAIRDATQNKMQQKIISATEKYFLAVKEEPSEVRTHYSVHEEEIERIESEFKKHSIGPHYQLNRLSACVKHRQDTEEDSNAANFLMGRFKNFEQAMSGGLPWTTGCLMYFGGRAHSGKTATVLAIGIDVALNDPNAIVIIHCTDDSYDQIEPRLRANALEYLNDSENKLSIGMIVQPNLYLPKDTIHKELYNRADDIMVDLIKREKLVIIDSDDGKTLSVLENHIRYYRQRYPGKKILVIADNTHNYNDHAELDSQTRMRLISDHQKNITTKYQCCMIATAEYRKNMPMNRGELKLPVDDDLADARALLYRPNVIVHVYSDLRDRDDYAEIYWERDGVRNPRLLLVISKNKIANCTEKLVMDLDPVTVSLRPVNPEEARRDSNRVRLSRLEKRPSVEQEANDYQ